MTAEQREFQSQLERGLLGAAIREPATWGGIRSAVEPKHFMVTAHREIYEAMGSVVSESGKVDPMLLADKLRSSGQLTKCGGMKFLAKLPHSVPVQANLQGYISKILEGYELREGEPASVWPEIVPLDAGRVPEFPVDALPPILARWVEEESREKQTPTAMAALFGIAACAAAVARKARVRIRGSWREPLNLFVCIVSPPGTRKSPVCNAAAAPLQMWEMDQRRIRAGEVSAARAMRDVLEGQAKAAKDRAARATGDAALQLAEVAVEAARRLDGTPVPELPRLLTDDCTPEQLAHLMHQHGGRIAVFAAEGTAFQQMCGRYSQNGSSNLEVYLQAWDGSRICVDRRGKPELILQDPALTLCLAVQPDVIEALSCRPEIRGRGMFARFLYAYPDPGLGQREVGAAAVTEQTERAYHRLIERLLNLPSTDPPLEMDLSQEAGRLLEEFERQMEPRLGPFGELGSMTDWGSKLTGHTARLAALLHLADHAEDRNPLLLPIRPKHVLAAAAIAEFCVPHAKAIYFGMGQDPQIAAAAHLLQWIQREGRTQFSRREIHQGCKSRIPRAKNMEAPLQIISECGYVRRFESSEKGKRGRKQELFLVNPALYNFENFEKGSLVRPHARL